MRFADDLMGRASECLSQNGRHVARTPSGPPVGRRETAYRRGATGQSEETAK
jgi:hypothetical protein